MPKDDEMMQFLVEFLGLGANGAGGIGKQPPVSSLPLALLAASHSQRNHVGSQVWSCAWAAPQ